MLALSRDPDEADLAASGQSYHSEPPLALLRREYRDFDEIIRDGRVLDHGCGLGRQSMAMLEAGASCVVGLDTNRETLERARVLARDRGFPLDRLRLVERIPVELRGSFDVVISKDSFEHYPDPARVLAEMKRAVRPGGRVLITFGPPWLAPGGSHMHFFTPVPWVNVWFSESTVMKVRARFRYDGAERYEDVDGGLNRMTVTRFEGLIADSGFELSWTRYRCVKSLTFIRRVPGLRELFINQVSCILRKPS